MTKPQNKNIFQRILSYAKEVFSEYGSDRGASLGAALAYYTVFSIAPALIIAIAVAGIFVGTEAVQGQLQHELSGLLGQEAAQDLGQIIQNAYRSGDSWWMTIVGIVTLIMGGTGVVNELKNSLNVVWEIKETPSNSILGYIKNRVLSLSFIIGLGFILMVSLGLNAFVVAFSDELTRRISVIGEVLAIVISIVLSLGMTTLMFALLFKYLPDTDIKWQDVWTGAFFTAVLFAIGKYLIGFYIGNSSISTTFGTAGALAALLVWVYYSSQIIILGAEFTQVWVRRSGRHIPPDKEAVKIEDGNWATGTKEEPKIAKK